MLKYILTKRELANSIKEDDITCENLKNSELWREDKFDDIGPINNWRGYCNALLNESFGNDFTSYPCSLTCGYCIPATAGALISEYFLKWHLKNSS